MGFIDSYIKVSDTDEARANLGAFGSKFGVELELLSPLPMDELQAKLITLLGQDLVRSNYGGYGTNNYSRWSVTSDSSIHVTASTPKPPQNKQWHSIELISPAFDTAGTACEEQLRDVFSLLREIGAVTNSSCGLHISSSCASISSANFKPFVFCALADDMTLLRRFGRLGNHYCAPTSPKAIHLVSLKAAKRRSATATHPHVGTREAHAALSVPARGLPSIAGKYHSVNIGKLSRSVQAGRIVEYRGIGGDYLSVMSSEQLVGIARRLGVSVLHAVHADIDSTLGSVISRYYAKVSSKLSPTPTAKSRRAIAMVERDLGALGVLRLHCGVSVRNKTETVNFKFILDSPLSPFEGYVSPLRTLNSRELLRPSWMKAPSADLQHIANSMLAEFFSQPAVSLLKPLFCKERSSDVAALRRVATGILAFKSANSAYLASIADASAKVRLPLDLTNFVVGVRAVNMLRALNLPRNEISSLMGINTNLRRVLMGSSPVSVQSMSLDVASCSNLLCFLYYWLIAYIRSGADVNTFDFAAFSAYVASEAPLRIMSHLAYGGPGARLHASEHRRIVTNLLQQHNMRFLNGTYSTINVSDTERLVRLALYSIDNNLPSSSMCAAHDIRVALSDAGNQHNLLLAYTEAITTACAWDIGAPTGRTILQPALEIKESSLLGAALYKLASLDTSSPS